MADIFISYLREDIEAAERLADALEAHGWSAFWDRRIPAGKRFDDFLDEQLHAARCVIVLWSRGSIQSPWVRDEAAVGRDRGILVPARLDDVLAPFGFRAIQAASLIGWQGDPSAWGFQQFVRDISAAIDVPAGVVAAGMAEPSPPITLQEEAEAKRQAEEEERLHREQQEAEAKRQAEEERQRREQQEAEAKRRAAEEERQRREQEEAEAKRRAAEEKRQRREQEEAEAKQRPAEDKQRQRAKAKLEFEEEAQLKPEVTNERPEKKKSSLFVVFGAIGIILLLVGLVAYTTNRVGQPGDGQPTTNHIVQDDSEAPSAPDQYRLGLKYRDGTGVPQDDSEAVKWFRKAADQGNADAQYGLGWMYTNGRGVPKDDAEAVKWYRKAADQGNASAQVVLGGMYAIGWGVAKDNSEALEWYQKAADQGNADAKAKLEALQDKLQKAKAKD